MTGFGLGEWTLLGQSPPARFIHQPQLTAAITLFLLGYYGDVSEVFSPETAEAWLLRVKAWCQRENGKMGAGLLQVSSPFCDREAPAGAVIRFCWHEICGGWAGREQPVAALQM